MAATRWMAGVLLWTATVAPGATPKESCGLVLEDYPGARGLSQTARFEAEVLAHPGDLEARGILGDHLTHDGADESTVARGDFLLSQLRLRGVDPEDAVAIQNEALRTDAGGWGVQAVRRDADGNIVEITLPSSALVANHRKIKTDFPFLRSVRLSNPRPESDEAAIRKLASFGPFMVPPSGTRLPPKMITRYLGGYGPGVTMDMWPMSEGAVGIRVECFVEEFIGVGNLAFEVRSPDGGYLGVAVTDTDGALSIPGEALRAGGGRVTLRFLGG